jgi:hypothetical protein
MAEDFKEDSDEKSENRSKHPIVEPQSPVNLREPLIDVRKSSIDRPDHYQSGGLRQLHLGRSTGKSD